MKEALLIIRHITWKKAANAIARLAAILLSRLLGRYINIGMPWSYSIEPCNVCNLHCRACASGLGLLNRRRGYIDLQDYKTAVDSIAPWAINLFLYFQGEPTLHPQFAELVQYAHSRRIHTATSTNGHYLTPTLCQSIVSSGLGKIIVSLDGLTQQQYEGYRAGGRLPEVIKGIRAISDAKVKSHSATPIIEVQTLVTRLNENSLTQIRKMAMEAGADTFVLKTMQIENPDDFALLNTSIDRYSRYNSQNKLKKPVGFCTRIINSAVITIDLDVLPCCYDKDAQYSFGNIKEQPLMQLLKSKKAKGLVENLEHQRNKRPPMCHNCGG